MNDPVLLINYAIVAIGLIIPVIAVYKSRISKLIPALAWLSVLLSAIGSTILLYNTMIKGPIQFYSGLLVHDSFTAFIWLGASLTAALSLLAAGEDPLIWESSPGYYSLLPFVLFGIFIITGANDALLILAAWLLVSVISYVYIALPPEKNSRAAAIRYIMIGAVATLFLAVWIAIDTALASQQGLGSFSLAPLTLDKISGLALATIIAALGFKTGIAPFHWWVPSVYGRADGRVVSIVAGVIKLGFIGLLAKITYALAGGTIVSMGTPILQSLQPATTLAYVFGILAVATMTYGNIAALTTKDLRALLSYSSIAQIGYILAALAALAYFSPRDATLANYAFAAIALQAVAYGLAKAPLFSLTSVETSQDRLRGLLSSNKIAGAAAGILLFSLLGMPPMLGFWGKLYMFIAVAGFSILLVVAAMINSAISSAYYVKMARDIVSEGENETQVPKHIEAAVMLSAIIILAFGFIAPLIFSIPFP